MISLRVLKKDGYLYTLEDDEQNQYELNLDFIDVDNTIEVDDMIEMNNDLLVHEKYTGLTFGKMDSSYGRGNLSIGDKDVIVLHKNGKEILLKNTSN